MREISITIPYEHDALSAAARMLSELVVSLEEGTPEPEPTQTELPLTQPEPEPEPEPEHVEEFDSAGVPWDARIHSKARTKLSKTGRWKRIRGVDAAFADSIEAQHTGTQNVCPSVTTFPELMTLIGRLGLAGDVINSVVISCGADSLPALGAQKELIPVVADALRKYEP